MNAIEQACKLIKDNIPELKGVYLFGSVATGEQRSDSDIDLAVLTERPSESVSMWNLAQTIAAAIGQDVDLVDLQTASTVFKNEIVTSAQRVLCEDQTYCDQFESIALSRYVRFNEARQSILDDVKQRGSIFNG